MCISGHFRFSRVKPEWWWWDYTISWLFLLQIDFYIIRRNMIDNQALHVQDSLYFMTSSGKVCLIHRNDLSVKYLFQAPSSNCIWFCGESPWCISASSGSEVSFGLLKRFKCYITLVRRNIAVDCWCKLNNKRVVLLWITLTCLLTLTMQFQCSFSRIS